MSDNILNRTPREEAINAIQEMIAKYIIGRTGVEDLREQSIYETIDTPEPGVGFEFISGTGFGERAYDFWLPDSVVDGLADVLENTL